MWTSQDNLTDVGLNQGKDAQQCYVCFLPQIFKDALSKNRCGSDNFENFKTDTIYRQPHSIGHNRHLKF